MDYPCGKFGVHCFIRFGFIVQTNRHTHTDAAKRFTPATVVGVSNNNTQDSGYGAVIMTESLRELTRFG